MGRIRHLGGLESIATAGRGVFGGAPTFVSSSNSNASNGPLIVAPPSGYQEGDLLIACVFNTSNAPVTSMPDGWFHIQASYDAAMGCVIIMAKWASASEGTITTGTLSGSSYILVCAYRGAKAILLAGSTKFTSATAPTISSASITPKIAGTLICLFSSRDGSTTAPTAAPTDMTLRASVGSNRLNLYDRSPSPAGSTGAKSISWVNSGRLAAAIFQII